MNLFIQGMRRSGTTILYDALREDPELRCFYEPLREQDETPGGGSGARDEDAFAETRAIRERFRAERYPELSIDEFNWGGPRDPSLELEPKLPAHCRELLGFLIEQADRVAIKETRLARKVADLDALDPSAAFVHMVRDPRAVASSIVLGRGRRQLERLGDADGFFADRKPRKLWSSREISEALPATAGIGDPSNVARVLIVWRDNFESARSAGMELFSERYLLLRNEDLRTDPAAGLGRLYSLLGREAPGAVVEWAAANVRAPEDPYAVGDRRWLEEIERTGVATAAAEAGYSVDPAATLER